MFGEALLNDAVAIVFTKEAAKYFLIYGDKDVKNYLSLSKIASKLLYILAKIILSMLAGFIMGIITSFITRFNRALGKEPITETMIVVLMGYTSHIIVEA